jgi:hypothetical protein
VQDSPLNIEGRVHVTLRDEHGRIKQEETVKNRVTQQGARYLTTRAIADAGQVAQATGMKLGTDSATAASFTGAGAALVGYITGSNKTFQSGFPTPTVQGNGWRIAWQCQWAAGVATNSDIEEVVIVNDAATNATTTEANTYARAIISTVNKGASDTLQIDWTWDLVGA